VVRRSCTAIFEVGKLSKHWDRSVREHEVGHIGLLPQVELVSAHPSAGVHASRPSGHHVDDNHRVDGHGVFTTLVPPPVKGESTLPLPPLPSPSLPRIPGSGGRSNFSSMGGLGTGSGKVPKLDFPYFDGKSPKLWVSRCENYFELYNLDPDVWVMFSMMHFKGAAGRWLQYVEKRLRSVSWGEFTKLLLDRFGREQQEILIRQLFHMRQAGSVSDYVK